MKTILVVEDSVDVRFLYQCALESDEYKVILAGNAQEALDIITKGSAPELVLLDLTLPDMTGSDLVAKFSENPALKNTKIILVSGREDLAATSKTLGTHGYLRKPFDLDHLCQTVDRYLAV